MSQCPPITFPWPEYDEGVPGHWLVPGNWTRGKAIGYVASYEGEEFTSYRAHRMYYRWEHLNFTAAGWRREDGTLVACKRDDLHAESYWEVTSAL